MRLVKPKHYEMAIWVLAHNPASATSNNEIRVSVAKGRDGLRGLSFDSIILSAASLGANCGDYVRIQDVATTKPANLVPAKIGRPVLAGTKLAASSF